MSHRRSVPSPRPAAVVALTTLTVVATLLGVPTPAPASAAVPWLCHPSRARDDCRGSLTTTVQHRDGSSRVVRPTRVRHPGVDCFYVYPTSSQQATPYAQARREASVAAVTRQQASRFSSRCRVFAPLYRQRTLAALAAENVFSDAQRARFNRLAYRDVLTAWRAYLRQHRPGRGFVLIGHSQGSRLLRKLVREQIDRRPAVRRDLVSAILPGANVLVRRGRDRGGDFRSIPLCRDRHQTGCVLAWSTFGQTPPADSRFGRTPVTDPASIGLGLPTGRRFAVACTNPTSLARNRRARAHSLTRSEPLPGLLGVLLLQTYGGPPPRAATPWLVPADRYTAQCQTSNGARVLLLRGVDGARRLNPSPNDTWGLHLLDVNIVLGDLVAILAAQVRTFGRRR